MKVKKTATGASVPAYNLNIFRDVDGITSRNNTEIMPKYFGTGLAGPCGTLARGGN